MSSRSNFLSLMCAAVFPERAILTFLTFAMFMISIEWNVALASNPISPMEESAGAADIIVIAKVIGMVDTDLAVRTRKHLGARWISVERTFKGVDATGQRLRALPDKLLGEYGQSYILFLKRLDDDWVQVIRQQPIEVTQDNINAVVKNVAAQGAGVLPKRTIWMQYTGAEGIGVIVEFFVTVDGNFTWWKMEKTESGLQKKHRRRTGHLSHDAITHLIRQVEEATPGSVTDDVDRVTFRWLDENEESHWKACYMVANQSPCEELLEAIEVLVRRQANISIL